MSKRQFVQNAATMTATALILRAIGIVFRIYLSAKIGAEGMGLYQLVFSIYVLASTFASAGISTAVARLITDELVCGNERAVKRILSRSVLLSMLIGCASAAAIYLSSHPIASYLLNDVRAVPSLKILGISLPFMGITSCLRGYYMARRRTLLPSISQIAEQLARIVFITVFLKLWGQTDVSGMCFAVIFGDALAEIVSSFITTIGYLIDRRHLRTIRERTSPVRRHGVLYRLLAIAAPITAGRYLNSVLRTVENILVPQKLAVYGHSTAISLAQFGMLKGMALPLLFFPASFLSSLSTLLIPELSEAHTLGQKRKVDYAVNKALQITLCISVWLAGIFTVFAYDFGELLYHSRDVGYLLRVLAPLMPVMYLESIVDGMLKGLNQQLSSLWYSVLDSAGRILLIVVLVPIKGMEGFLLIMVISNLATSFLNVHRLLSVTGIRMQWENWLLKPLVAVSAASLMTSMIAKSLLYPYLSLLLTLIAGCFISTVLYFGISLVLGVYTIKDLRIIATRRS